ncbi:hypothetical protein M33023_05800 [Candidatus Phytoplasma asteris]|uniref:Uncharacterized protein n=2 Tax=16SrI (Aster yellows group) TaxID=3042590 RepID=Q2NIR3_AYWBP|nr:hypothetical protein AYWB_563 [Aster yellows witches'-broom phytoplasma AYWB]
MHHLHFGYILNIFNHKKETKFIINHLQNQKTNILSQKLQIQIILYFLHLYNINNIINWISLFAI